MNAIRTFCLPLCALLLSASCSRGGAVDEPAPTAVPAVAAAGSAPRFRAVVSAADGVPVIISSGAERPAVVGEEILPGEVVVSGADGWAELSFGPETAGSPAFAVVRALPGSRLALGAISPAYADGLPRRVELVLSAGIAALKVGALSGRDEFIVLTRNAAAAVRGTAFLVEAAENLTRVSVGAGVVAALPKGPLFAGLLDGRAANPVAGAVVRTAFAFAPAARAGEELVVGGAAGDESAYGALTAAAERARANGFALEDAGDPSGLIAAEGSEARGLLDKLSASYPSAPLPPESAGPLAVLRGLRDPTLGYEALPIALPVLRTEAVPAPPRALLWSVRVGAAPLSDSLTRAGDLIVALDASGTVSAVDGSGALRWTSDSGALAVTAVGDAVAAASPDGLSVLDGASGAERGRYAYPFTAAGPSAKPVAVPEGLAVATPRGITLLRAENAALLREIPVEGGVVSIPVLAGRELVCVAGGGDLAFIDLSSAAVVARLPAGLGSAPFPPRCKGDLLVASDRSGHLAAFSASRREALWSRELGVKLNIEPELSEDRVFAWTADRTLRCLSAADGSDAADAVPDVLSPPLLSEGRLYWGGPGGVLVVADAASGRALKRIGIAESGTVRPIMVNGALYAGTGGGKIVKVDPSRP